MFGTRFEQVRHLVKDVAELKRYCHKQDLLVCFCKKEFQWHETVERETMKKRSSKQMNLTEISLIPDISNQLYRVAWSTRQVV